jgi:hypothetical protein
LNVVDKQGNSVHVRITDDNGAEVPMTELRVRIAQHEAVREFDA